MLNHDKVWGVGAGHTGGGFGSTTRSREIGKAESIPNSTKPSRCTISDRNNQDFQQVKYECPEHDKELNELKEEILGAKGVVAFDLEKRIKIYTDAAKTGGMGYALCQPNDERDLRLVACGSTSLTDAQRRYAIVELREQQILLP